MKNKKNSGQTEYPNDKYEKTFLPKIFGMLNIILGIFGMFIIINLSSVIAGRLDEKAGLFTATYGLIITLPMIIGGIGMIMYRNWGRITTLAAAWLSLAAAVIYILLLITAFTNRGYGMSEFTKSLLSVLAAAAFPVASIVFLHGRKFREAMK